MAELELLAARSHWHVGIADMTYTRLLGLMPRHARQHVLTPIFSWPACQGEPRCGWL